MNDLIPFGKIVNHYKFGNEIIVQHRNVNEKKISALRFVFILLYQQHIPYKVLSIRTRYEGESIVVLDCIPTYEAVKKILKKEVFIEQHIAKQIAEKVEKDFFGYALYDENTNAVLGTITNTEHLASQFLATIQVNQKEVFIPLHQNLITQINHEKKIITMKVPHGLLELE